MNTFTKKGYGRIFVAGGKRECSVVEQVIKEIDEFEHSYLPDGFVAPISEFPLLRYTHKFDSLNINLLIKRCLERSIVIVPIDNGLEQELNLGL